MDYAVPYLRCRAAGIVPASFASTSFAAYRGLLNTVTPLRVSLTTNLLNLALDPLFIFGLGRGGAATPLSSSLSSPSSWCVDPLFLSNGSGPSGAGAGLGAVRCELIQYTVFEAVQAAAEGGFAMLLSGGRHHDADIQPGRRVPPRDTGHGRGVRAIGACRGGGGQSGKGGGRQDLRVGGVPGNGAGVCPVVCTACNHDDVLPPDGRWQYRHSYTS